MNMNFGVMESREIEGINLDNLIDICNIKVDTSLPAEERIADYIRQIKNPYCYKCGDIVVKIKFADTDVTMEECMENYLRSI